VSPARQNRPVRVAIEGARFTTTAGSPRTFAPRGFNYDWTWYRGREQRLEDLLFAHREKIDCDFAAMKRLGANTVRIFLPIATFLRHSQREDEEALERLDHVLQIATRYRLRLIVTGLGMMRARALPSWLRRADDRCLARAETTFWSAVARHCRTSWSILAYDIQNEPAVHWRNDPRLAGGGLTGPSGQRFWYVHWHLRRVERRWTSYVHRRFGFPGRLRRRWPDYPRAGERWSRIAIPRPTSRSQRLHDYLLFHDAVLRAWTKRLAAVIRREDPQALVTVGALDPSPIWSTVDFASVHLYPPRRAPRAAFAAACERLWRNQIASLPADKPVLVEEFFPLRLPAHVRPETVNEALRAATGTRAAGWLSFYFGRPEELANSATSQRDLAAYRAALKMVKGISKRQ
jgi:Beta-galactosidase